MGRRAISTAEKISDVHQRQICFTKRRNGLFNKARHLVLQGCSVAIVVFSDYGNCFTFAHPDIEDVESQFRSRLPPFLPPILEGDEAAEEEEEEEEETESDDEEDDDDGEEMNEEITTEKLAENLGYEWNAPVYEMGAKELLGFGELLEALQTELRENSDML